MIVNNILAHMQVKYTLGVTYDVNDMEFFKQLLMLCKENKRFWHTGSR